MEENAETTEPEKTITIPLSEFQQLYDDSRKLYYLEIGGVDNWDWYSESLQPYWAEQEAEAAEEASRG